MNVHPLRASGEETVYPLIVIAGPTGSGKSALALRAAARFSGEIINCDSLQVFRHFDVGTAKLSEAERLSIPHHLIDIADPSEHFTAGEYARRAREALGEIAGRASLPIVAGGTGLYLRALLAGLFAGPARDTGLRERLLGREHRRPGSLFRLLKRLDPAAASRIHPRDTKKIVRALEVRLAGGKPITQFFEDGRSALTGFRALKLILNPPRQQLHALLDERMERMFRIGLIEETQRILDLGYSPGAKPFESLGYKQALQVIRGELTQAEALEQARARTRQYAKRQITWFRKEPDAVWLEGFGTDPEMEERALALIEAHLNR